MFIAPGFLAILAPYYTYKMDKLFAAKNKQYKQGRLVWHSLISTALLFVMAYSLKLLCLKKIYSK